MIKPSYEKSLFTCTLEYFLFRFREEARYALLRNADLLLPPGSTRCLDPTLHESYHEDFRKHGMTNVGYWIPNNNTDNALYYILSYPSQAARDTSWSHFGKDPEWKEVARKSEESGKIVAKVTSIFMNATDFSPKIKPSNADVDRTFEMRTYTAAPDKLPNVLARFREHTTKLFKKHGMENIAYFTTIPKDGSQSKLLYFLAHKSEAAGKASFDAFRLDPKWIAVKEASEKDGKIVEKVESIYMSPTTFSTIR